MIFVDGIKIGLDGLREEAGQKALERLGLSRREVSAVHVRKISVDARKGRVNFVYGMAVEILDGGRENAFAGIPGVRISGKNKVSFPLGEKVLPSSPVICGFGPRGMMCALALARRGFHPTVLEQGQDVDSRARTVEKFYSRGVLNPFSNIRFGEGGRGTFSDGKLMTRISDGRSEYVLDAFISHGAPRDIAYRARPHLGTDLLAGVVKGIRQEIISLGGKVLFNTRLTGINIKDGRVVRADTDAGRIPADLLVLAAGHSARPLFRLLREKGADMEPKPFSVGVRIEHLQSEIDRALYHRAAGDPRLPQGEYNLSADIGGRGVYTFCMCPGGYVAAAASEEGGTVTNGMSFHARDGRNANSAFVVSVLPSDFGNDFSKAVGFQRALEKKAFEAAGGGYRAPGRTVGAFLEGRRALELKRVSPTYPLGVEPADFGEIFPPFVCRGLRGALPVFGRKIKGFSAPDSVLTGVETRTSSPVRIKRDGLFQSNIRGIYPAGEGAGYAGGIMSAAVDGIRVAQRICEAYRPL